MKRAQLPPTVADQNGNIWWTVATAAKEWGVSPGRVYKWIYGRANESKGTYTLRDGTRVPRRNITERRRLTPVTDFQVVTLGNRKIIIVRPQAYPEPIVTPMTRPTGIGQGDRRSDMTYEAAVGRDNDPFLAPFSSEVDFSRKSEAPITERKSRAKKPQGEKPKVEEVETMPAIAGDFVRARYFADRLRRLLAQNENRHVEDVTDADVRYLARKVADRTREDLRQAGAAREEIDAVRSEDTLLDWFSQLVSGLLPKKGAEIDSDFAWARNPDEVARARAAFLEIYRNIGMLDGMPNVTAFD